MDNTIAWLQHDYESIFKDGSGEMKLHQGLVHKYLGMTLDFSTKHQVKISMTNYVSEIVEAWDKAELEVNDGFIKKKVQSRATKQVQLQRIYSRLMRIQPNYPKSKLPSFTTLLQRHFISVRGQGPPLQWPLHS